MGLTRRGGVVAASSHPEADGGPFKRDSSLVVRRRAIRDLGRLASGANALDERSGQSLLPVRGPDRGEKVRMRAGD